MLVMWGPGVRRGLRLRGSHIMDVMPTILQILGLPIPREVDGRVLGEALEHHEQLSDLARKLVTLPSGEKRLTRAEEELIRTRLKNLGYFE
jgi:arylsulfatase A-like enzyme